MASLFSAQTIESILNDIGAVIGTVKAIDPNIGSSPIVADAENLIGKYQADAANYEAGQAVVLSTMSYNGKAGTIVAVMNGGPAAQSLGL